jgi:hypothetical protein
LEARMAMRLELFELAEVFDQVAPFVHFGI